MSSPPTPLRVRVVELRGGWHLVSIACPCARVGRHAASWERDGDVLAELLQRHRRTAPLCPHRSVIPVEVTA